MSPMLDARSASTATAAEASGYWNHSPDESRIVAAEALAEPRHDASVDAENATAALAARRQALGDPIPIDGDTNTPEGRTRSATPDGKPVVSDPVHRGAEVTITRERTLADAGGGRQYISSDQLVLTTGAGDDKVRVRQNRDGTLAVEVNGERYAVAMAEGQELTIRSGAGNDVIDVSPDVTVNLVVEGGAGDDSITTGAGNDRIDGGAGDDVIRSGAGRDDVFGNDGDDTIDAGAGDDVVYGGNGADLLQGAGGNDYLEGGRGADRVEGGRGNDILSGGRDADELLGGAGNDRVYAGAGEDAIANAGGEDTIYAQEADDRITAERGARNTVVNVVLDGTPGAEGVRVEGSDAFRQRVEADIELMRASPNGRRMLGEFDAAAARGNTVTIRELANEQNGYALSSGGEIRNGRPSPGSDAEIRFNPSFHMDAFQAPIVVLYHEMSHAYNGVNGTFLPGTYSGPDRQDAGAGVPNAERQAVGLETTAPAYDFDGDPATPPTNHNPLELSENGLRTEMGLPLRLHYAL